MSDVPPATETWSGIKCWRDPAVDARRMTWLAKEMGLVGMAFLRDHDCRHHGEPVFVVFCSMQDFARFMQDDKGGEPCTVFCLENTVLGPRRGDLFKVVLNGDGPAYSLERADPVRQLKWAAEVTKHAKRKKSRKAGE